MDEQMRLDLETLQQLAEELGLRCASPSPDELIVDVCNEVPLCFRNLLGDDVLVSFEGADWHMHPPFTFLPGNGRYVEHDEATLLHALASGELLVVESRLFGTVIHRALMDRREGLDTKHLARARRYDSGPRICSTPAIEATALQRPHEGAGWVS
jgi:hypothetical protein